MRRLRVDPVACDAFGHCAELAPELIWLDEWGYPVVDGEPVPPGLEPVAEAAVRACPRQALFWEAVDRRVAASRAPSRAPSGTADGSAARAGDGRRRVR
jgi:ferredoxin